VYTVNLKKTAGLEGDVVKYEITYICLNIVEILFIISGFI